MAKFEQKESYLHLAAKQLLYSWLKKLDDTQDSCTLTPISWRSNYGVYMELPFHETDDPYYFELSSGLIPYEKRLKIGLDDISKCTEWFDKNFDRGKILFVPDITIFHKGTATILIEIVHTNVVTDKKIEAIKKFFNGHWVTLFEIRAIDILNNTRIPDSLNILNTYEF